jgi:hypothetical protein
MWWPARVGQALVLVISSQAVVPVDPILTLCKALLSFYFVPSFIRFVRIAKPLIHHGFGFRDICGSSSWLPSA